MSDPIPTAKLDAIALDASDVPGEAAFWRTFLGLQVVLAGARGPGRPPVLPQQPDPGARRTAASRVVRGAEPVTVSLPPPTGLVDLCRARGCAG